MRRPESRNGQLASRDGAQAKTSSASMEAGMGAWGQVGQWVVPQDLEPRKRRALGQTEPPCMGERPGPQNVGTTDRHGRDYSR